MTKRWTRLVASAGVEVVGSDRLDFLTYLCQEAGDQGGDLWKRFCFHRYRVSNQSYAGFDQVIKWNFLEEVEDDNGVVAIGLGFEAREISDYSTFPIVKALFGEVKAVLDVLSFIIYLQHRCYEGVKILLQLASIKPELSLHFGSARDLAEEHKKPS